MTDVLIKGESLDRDTHSETSAQQTEVMLPPAEELSEARREARVLECSSLQRLQCTVCALGLGYGA